MPVPPAALTSAAVSSMVSGRLYSERRSRVLRPVTYTIAPDAPSSTAIPHPAPRVAPATNATRSCSAICSPTASQFPVANFQLKGSLSATSSRAFLELATENWKLTLSCLHTS